jgi:hypothetical protein
MRFTISCVGTATVLPAIDAIGVGWFSTITALFVVAATCAVYVIVIWGPGWREERAKRLGEKNRAGSHE